MPPPPLVAEPPCSVISFSVSVAPLATSKKRKTGAGLLRSILSPLPTMVKLSLRAMTGKPLLPLAVVLFTWVSAMVLFGASVMVFDPPAVLAALMSAIRSETVAAVKLEGNVRSSNCSRVSRPGLWGEGREATADRVLGRFRQPGYHWLNH